MRSLVAVISVVVGLICAVSAVEKLSTSSPMPETISLGDQFKSNRTIIRIISELTYTGFYGLGSLASEPHRIALERLRSIPSWLPNYDIEFEVFDDKCDDAVSVHGMMERLLVSDAAAGRFPIIAINDLSALPQELQAGITAPLNFVSVASYINSLKLYTEKPRFRNFFGLGERSDYFCTAVAKFVKKIGWARVGMISDIDATWNLFDQWFSTYFDAENITISWIAKTWMDERQSEEDMYESYVAIRDNDVRIIVISSWDSLTSACWLHRVGLYGPRYVIIFGGWIQFDENSDTPSQWPWCSKLMLLDVLGSMFYYVDRSIGDVFGFNETRDVTGLSSSQLRAMLINRIEHVETHQSWNSAPYWNYDRTLFIGLILNHTEAILNSRNQTLSDWTTDKLLFQTKGAEIVSVIREAVLRTRFNGLKGIYKFDRSTELQTGIQPVTIAQVFAVSGNRSEQRVVAAYVSWNKDDPILIKKDRPLKWRTQSKNPPRDSLLVIEISEPLLSLGSNIALKTCSALVISSNLLLAAIHLMLKNGRSKTLKLHFLIILGNLLILSHTFVIPVESTVKMDHHCSAVVFLIISGLSSLWASLMSLVQEEPPSSNRSHATYRGEALRLTYHLTRLNARIKSKPASFIICLTLIQSSLILAILLSTPVADKKVLTQVNTIAEGDVVSQSIRDECSVTDTLFSPMSSQIMTGIICGLFALVIIKSFHMARTRGMVHNKYFAISVFCALSVLFGGTLVAATMASSGRNLMLTVSITVIVQGLIVTIPMYAQVLSLGSNVGPRRSSRIPKA